MGRYTFATVGSCNYQINVALRFASLYIFECELYKVNISIINADRTRTFFQKSIMCRKYVVIIKEDTALKTRQL